MFVPFDNTPRPLTPPPCENNGCTRSGFKWRSRNPLSSWPKSLHDKLSPLSHSLIPRTLYWLFSFSLSSADILFPQTPRRPPVPRRPPTHASCFSMLSQSVRYRSDEPLPTPALISPVQVYSLHSSLRVVESRHPPSLGFVPYICLVIFMFLRLNENIVSVHHHLFPSCFGQLALDQWARSGTMVMADPVRRRKREQHQL